MMIKDFTPRLYQQTILATCAEKNTLVVLPTGLGKTNVFMMLAAHRLSKYPDKKILFLGPTRPLINQYFETFKKHMDIEEKDLAVFTGHVKPEKRELLWKSSKVIFSTPQGLENDIITNRIDISEVSLLGFDEAHRAIGEYSYVWIAKQYRQRAREQRIIALTASPGANLEKISEVCKNLYIEEIEARTDDDPDVKPYIHEVDVKWVNLELPPELKDVKKYLDGCIKAKLVEINELGQIDKKRVQDISKRSLLALQAELHSEIARGSRDYSVMKSISLLAEVMKVQHAIELLETQGISPLHEYLEGILKLSATSRVKAVQNLSRDVYFKSALIKTRTLFEVGIEHPKFRELESLVEDEIEKDKDAKLIVFSQYRDTIVKIYEVLNKIKGVRAEMFVGQAKRKGIGLSQKKQIEMLERFRDKEFNVLVMSSVGEEGLDIPKVNTVIFYEPIPSAIRTIQRKGRTGRHGKGKVYVLVTKGTRDEAYRWSAFHKQKNMHRVLSDLKNGFKQEDKDRTLGEFVHPDEDVVIYADYREKASGVIKKLIEKGIKISLEKLEIGDYMLSSRVCVEYKTVPDFVDSIIDKRLISQAKALNRYTRPILIIQGREDIYAQRNIHPNAIRGILSTLAVDFAIPIIQTKDDEESASILAMIAKREQMKEEKGFTLHSAKPLTLKEQQEYIIACLPGIGGTLSKPILREFKTIKNIVNASEEELQKVDLIGKKKAKTIKEIFEGEYI